MVNRHQDEYLGLWPWAPGGYVDRRDAQAITAAVARNIRQPGQRYARTVAWERLDRGDESFGGNSNAYIPVLIAGYGEIRANIGALVGETNPAQPQPPSMRQLTQQLYSSASSLWQRIRSSNNSGWNS